MQLQTSAGTNCVFITLYSRDAMQFIHLCRIKSFFVYFMKHKTQIWIPFNTQYIFYTMKQKITCIFIINSIPFGKRWMWLPPRFIFCPRFLWKLYCWVVFDACDIFDSFLFYSSMLVIEEISYNCCKFHLCRDFDQLSV